VGGGSVVEAINQYRVELSRFSSRGIFQHANAKKKFRVNHS
jgi:hypothetical protein